MTALGEVGQGIEPLMTICRYMITNRVRLGEPERWGCSWTERGTRCLTPGPEGPPGCVTHPGRRGSPGGWVRLPTALNANSEWWCAACPMGHGRDCAGYPRTS